MAGLVVAALGCHSQVVRSEAPEQLDKLLAAEEASAGAVRLVRDLTVPLARPLKVESVALVTGLDGTGGDPPPSPLRASLIGEMQTHEVNSPQRVLASPNTAMVLVRGFLPPGVQKGDRFDVELQAAPRSGATSLRGGWLMRSRMREVRILDHSVHTGHVIALAQGPILVDAVFGEEEGEVSETRGRVLGGGVALQSRPLGLVVYNQYSSVRTSAAIGAAINARFHRYDHGVKRGVATPKDDNYIELAVHPRYKHNLGRYLRVVRSVALGDGGAARAIRLAELQHMLEEPITAADAALQLEAIGPEAVETLKHGLASPDPEVRFYAAEALGYLDEASAAAPLAEAARQRAFRWHALAALAAMDHVAAYEALVDLLDDPSAETRVGAFHALRVRNPRDELVRGELLGDGFFLYAIPTTGPPMVHFSSTRRAELLVFGHDQQIRPPEFLFAGKQILVKADGADQLKVCRFAPGEPDRVEYCSRSLVDLIRLVGKLGAGYADVKQLIDEAKRAGLLDSRVAVNALPRPGRVYHRNGGAASGGAPEDLKTPLPSLFGVPLGGFSSEAPPRPAAAAARAGSSGPAETAPSWFARIGRWLSL